MFDIKRFKKARFEPRTAEVRIKELDDFFEPGTEPVFRVRGLTGHELARSHDAVERNRDVNAAIEGLVSSRDKDKAGAIRSLLGVDREVPDEVARRLEQLVIGSVDPELDLEAAGKLCKAFPIEFYLLTNKIAELTGLGSVEAKKKSSGDART